ncbi:hypothetical protein BJ993_003775 [Nocardioides aromaticivorans]|uniref:FHA domain-containing protein n=1 Tax=Nocardioides aromaticivorans TaxID=200618 RepID=A0A7Z0CQ81_9ACTN|nr:FHA domain-containing protein [Nocardioides aromaticivorans]NYI46695.1 hypothetical protein [Nocardioides aromaticivorans]
MSASYAVGELATLVTPQGIVLAAADRLADLVPLAGADLDPLKVVEALSRGALGDLPDFAVVRVDGSEARVLVRGGFAVRIAGFAVEGRDAATWTEATAALTPGDTVEVAPVGTPLAGATLPITAGVVRSAGLAWVPVPAAEAEDPAPAAVRIPAPAAAPEPVEAAPVEPAPVEPAPQEHSPAAEHTVLRTPASAAAPVVPPPAPPAPPAPPVAAPAGGWPAAPVADPDHDGRTITPAQLQALRAGQAGVPVVPTSPPGPPAPPVPPAPPGPPAPPAPPTSHQPPPPPVRALVALQLSSGRVVTIRRRVLIGRSPRVQQVGGSANLPALVTVDDPYVSSTHLEVACDGIRVTVTDTSTNGTLLARQGRTPVALDHGVATEVAVGDVLTLSKGLTATVIPSPER